jgi:hypothetical protein
MQFSVAGAEKTRLCLGLDSLRLMETRCQGFICTVYRDLRYYLPSLLV